MKCVILAAGEGIRMRPLTNEEPKPMLKISGKPILEHILKSLPSKVNRVILVVGYLNHKIHDYFGHHFGRLKLDYIIQEGKLGTYHALKLCEPLLDDGEKFLMLYADDLHGAENIEECSGVGTCSILAYETEEPRKFGVIETSEGNIIKGIEEKPDNPKTNLVSTGVMLLDKNIFNYPARRHVNGEYYLTDSISQMIEAGHKFLAVKSNFWLPIGYPSDLSKAEEILSTKS